MNKIFKRVFSSFAFQFKIYNSLHPKYMKVLYYYPENPLLLNQGNNARALSLLKYFKDRKFEVDLVGERANNFTEESISQLKELQLISEGYLLKDFKRKKNQLKYFFFYSLPNKISGKLKDFDRSRFGQRKHFNDILEKNEYDFIIISYVYWASLIKDNPNVKKAKLVIDTHDFLTSQFQNQKKFDLGKYFDKEINTLNLFDKVLVISNEEKYIFSQFVKKEIAIVTHTIEQKNSNIEIADRKYDLVYVASNNEHNVKSAKWFFEEVFPKIDKNITICVVGRITAYCPDGSNISKLEYVENLDSIYQNSKIAICPMLSGTGLKIKVVEALSFGLPIVCNERGVDGMINKTNNGCLVTNDPVKFANYISRLATDLDFYNENSVKAKQFFAENHSVETVYDTLDEVFN